MHGKSGTQRSSSAFSFIFPIARPMLSTSELEQDLPRLGNRQFVVDRSGRDEADVLAERRQFWSRQALLQNVKAWWGIVSVSSKFRLPVI